MLPERTARYQTKLQRKTLNPYYDERFEFRVSSSEALLSHLLHFSIFDFDRFSRHDLIGTAVMQPRLHSPDAATEQLYVLDIAGRQLVIAAFYCGSCDTSYAHTTLYCVLL